MKRSVIICDLCKCASHPEKSEECWREFTYTRKRWWQHIWHNWAQDHRTPLNFDICPECFTEIQEKRKAAK